MASTFGTTAEYLNDTNATTEATPSFAVSVGDLIWVGVAGTSANNPGCSSVTDSAGNLYTFIRHDINSAGTDWTEIWACLGATVASATNVITVNHASNTSFRRIRVITYSSSLGNYWTYDVGGFGTSSVTTITTASTMGTNTVTESVGFAIVSAAGNNGWTAGSGSTLRGTNNTDTMSEDKLLTAIGAQVMSFTGTLASAKWMSAAEFYATSTPPGGGAAPTRSILMLLKRFSQQPLSPWLGFPQPDTFRAGNLVTFDVAVAGAAVVAAAESTTRNLAAAVAGAAAVTVDDVVARSLAVSVAGTATVAAAMSRTLILAVPVDGNAAVAAAMTVSSLKVLAVTVDGNAVVSVALKPLTGMAVDVQGQAFVSPQIVVKKIFATSIAGAAQIIADISAGHIVLALIPAGPDDLITPIPAGADDLVTLTVAGADSLLTLTPAGADDTITLTPAGADDLITLTPGAKDIG